MKTESGNFYALFKKPHEQAEKPVVQHNSG